MGLHSMRQRSAPGGTAEPAPKPSGYLAGRPSTRSALAISSLLALLACAPALTTRPATATIGEGQPDRTVTAPARGTSSANFSRTILPGSRLRYAGSIPEGQIWRPVGWVLLAEGRHMHEAYVVERDGQWIGFYLPVERAFSPLASPPTLRTETSS
ncbi:hypothetical protein ACFQS7_26715 [Dankookia sp. GCM10030260]|uniref:hypothetical protein n=1 Tax=Dankookia sp. GCM10030260 TaxID=3273390 RepID=UPI0036084798